jgi:hypothetical protein
MPTKTNKSPLTLPPQLIMPLVKGGIGGVTGGFSAGIDEFKQVRDELKEQDFKEQKFGKKLGMLGKAGARSFGAYLQGALGGISKGLLGTDFGLSEKGILADNQPGAEEVEQQPTYRTNIDPMTGEEIPLMMTGNMKPLKMLTGIKGNIPHNMSAAQYKSALKMSEISGSSSLPVKGVVEDWEEGLGKARFGDDYDPKKADID